MWMQTNILYFVCIADASETLSIIKTCTKNSSCQLQIKEHADSFPCDQAGSDWICTSCCNDDGCNLNSAPTRISNANMYFIFILCFITKQINVL